MISTRRHLEALRTADLRAVAIKDEADERARNLAVEAQRYRDEQHNKLREQIVEERGEYVPMELYTQRHESLENEIKVLSERVTQFISAQIGRGAGTLDARTLVLAVMGLVVGATAVIAAVLVGVFH